jgi:hypothetical protein
VKEIFSSIEPFAFFPSPFAFARAGARDLVRLLSPGRLYLAHSNSLIPASASVSDSNVPYLN